ncbi:MULTISPECIES: type IV secretory system conjugative DNA transfer family protein [Gordonia]|nr:MULTISPECIES: TraM recognition domain-containing protein [Gordonia]
MLVGLGVIVAAALIVWGSLTLAGGQQIPGNPFAAVIMVASGKLAWPTAATVWAVVIVAVIGAVVGTGLYVWSGRKPHRTRVDSAQQHLGSGKEIASIRERAVAEKARSLGIDSSVAPAPFTTVEGVPIGKELVGKGRLLGSWEDMHLDIWGPRQGKSTSRIIPAICEAPGAVLTTENKRGNLDHTRLVREFRDEDGNPTRQVWVFDPQQVANEPAWWWWNPLSYVEDETQAEELAQLFSVGDDGLEAKKDPYFDPEGEDLLANLILASALAGEPITTVYERLVDENSCHHAVEILREHGYPMIARALNARLGLPEKQKAGIFGTSVKMAKCLRNRSVQEWITRGDTERPHLDLEAYIRNGETLYCLSKEGVGSTGPLVAALTVAATRTAEKIATASPGGRLPVPMLCPLDEAANVVRWPDLPKLYSHFGSRGIIIMTILQSWSQGVGVFGERNMKLLESSSNVYVYGGNVREKEYLASLSELCGDFTRVRLSVSDARTGKSSSRSTDEKKIFTVADLQAWPRGRALVLSAGNRPTVAETVPWMAKPYADLIRQSLNEYAPKGQ